MATFGLVVNGHEIAEGTRGDLIKWVEWYYVKRAGYEKAAVNLWVRRREGVIMATVQLRRKK
jgi:hypothetical protein